MKFKPGDVVESKDALFLWKLWILSCDEEKQMYRTLHLTSPDKDSFWCTEPQEWKARDVDRYKLVTRVTNEN